MKSSTLFRRTILTAFVFSSFILAFPSNIFAQSVTPTVQNNIVTTQDSYVSSYFTIKVTPDTQSVWTNRVPLNIEITPNIDSEKTEVQIYAPSQLKVYTRYSKFFAVSKGTPVLVKADLAPQQSGSYDVTVNVVSWKYNNNYTNSQNLTLTFDNNLKLTPQGADYSTNLTIKYVIVTFIVIGLLVGAFFGGKVGLKKLAKWLKPPE